MMARRRAVLIAGPTASGKSALALSIARQLNGVVVNADAMQVYDTLRIVTARPSVAEEELAPHRLYGTIPADRKFSTGEWLREVAEMMASEQPDRPLLFVGGTGLYFDALINGFADIPEISPGVLAEVEADIAQLDGTGRLRLLMEEDPRAAERLKVADPQRLARALAVKRATGRTLSSFQDAPRHGLLDDFDIERMVLDVPRPVLRDRIARRFEAMFETGAVEEVMALRALGLDPALPVTKAIGVREIGEYLDGMLGRDEAVTLATIATQQYAKRQGTWFRNRFGDWPRGPISSP
jgi:tRNA dimethylallyltransferase